MNRVRLLNQLINDEGLRLRPYLCTEGKLTIGVGRNLDDRGITEAEAMYLCNNDIDACIKDLNRSLPWWKDMDDVRQEVMVNMVFNLGIKRLLGFRKALSAMRTGDYDKAAAEMLDSKWARQVGDRSKRLANMMKKGSA